jgi:hypothetical protein
VAGAGGAFTWIPGKTFYLNFQVIHRKAIYISVMFSFF